MQNKFSEMRVQSIMESFGGMQPAVAPDFFYTRLRAKMEQPVEKKKTFFVLRPVFVTAISAVLLIANIISLLQTDKLPKKQEQVFVQSKPATIESFAAAYDMNSVSVYE